MNMSLFICLLFLFQLFYWFVGRRASKKVQDTEDYFLAGKNVVFFPLMMTFLASQVGGGLVLGAADAAYQFGWPVLLYPLGSALGLILLGSGMGRRLAGFQFSTVAQIFEVVYGSSVLRKLASILSVLSLFMILVAQIIASSKFLISLGLTSPYLFVLFWAIVIIYTAQGGLKALIATDIVQATLFSAVFLLCLGFVLYTAPSLNLLPTFQIDQISQLSSKFCGWLFMPLLFMVIEQDMGQRCFAGASPRIVSRAAFCSGIAVLFICVVPVFFGTLAKSMGLIIPEGGSVLMTVISSTTTPWLTAIAGCSILAAIISTSTSLISAISSNLSSDFQQQVSLRTTKGITCLISLAAIVFAFYFDNIVDILIQSYELSVSCLFVPIFMALLKKRGNFLSALFSILCGGLGFVLFRLYPVPFPREIVSLLLSFIGFGCGEFVSYYRNRLTPSC